MLLTLSQYLSHISEVKAKLRGHNLYIICYIRAMKLKQQKIKMITFQLAFFDSTLYKKQILRWKSSYIPDVLVEIIPLNFLDCPILEAVIWYFTKTSGKRLFLNPANYEPFV